MKIDPAAFKCRLCGVCCRVPGCVLLAPGEADTIAAFLELDVYEFTSLYTHLSWDRKELSLTEQEDGSCIFVQEDNTCRIQPVKPRQCRDFPFTWCSDLLRRECPALASMQLPDGHGD